MQWDGKYLAIGNNTEGAGTIYQFAINGEKGTKVGSTPLNGSGGAIQFWIEQANVYRTGTLYQMTLDSGRTRQEVRRRKPSPAVLTFHGVRRSAR